MSCEVVITGMGVVSPVGIDIAPFWEGLLGRRSGVAVRPEFSSVDHPFRIAAEVRDFEPKTWVQPRKSLKVMCRPIQLGFAASAIAMKHAGIAGNVDPDRLSTMFGTEAFYADPHEVASVFRKCIVNRCYDHDRWGQYAMGEIEPLWMLKYLPNMVASHLSIAFDARGPSNTICQADASSLLAIIEAADMIRRGAADAAIAGGTGSLMATTGMIYRGLHRLSRRIEDPERASRPFDKSRDGMVVGEGAASFVLERASFAEARGAKPIARICSYTRGYSNPEFMGTAIADSIRTSLERAGLSPNSIGHFNAHGFSTIEDDIREAAGIRAALGDVPVIAPKASLGNLGPGAGAIELAASILACQNGILPPTINIDELDERCPINLVTQDGVKCASTTAMKLSFTEAGQLATIIVST
jgi:3-oxoacyl-[acyl-carrier-protein] synthase II